MFTHKGTPMICRRKGCKKNAYVKVTFGDESTTFLCRPHMDTLNQDLVDDIKHTDSVENTFDRTDGPSEGGAATPGFR